MYWGQGPWPVTQFPQAEAAQKFIVFSCRLTDKPVQVYGHKTQCQCLPHSVEVKGRQDGEEEGPDEETQAHSR